MKQKKSTKKFLKSAAKPKHGSKETTKPKKSFGKRKPKSNDDDSMEVGQEESYINLKKPTGAKGKNNSIKR